VPERNSKGDPTPKQTEANTPELLRIQQLTAELWLESSLNYLGDRLNDCLASNATQRNACGSSAGYVEPAQWNACDSSGDYVEPEGAIFQTLVMQLNIALENSGVALALPEISTSVRSQEPEFKVCHIAPASTEHLELPLPTVMLATGNMLPLTPTKVIAWSDLQHLQLQKPQSAWPLLDLQGGVIAWLITATPKESPGASYKAQLKPQLIERSLTATVIALAQYGRFQATSLKCQQLEVHNRELVRNTQLKSEFLANTSHEIRTPLSSILGFTHLLLAQGYKPDNLRHQEYLNIILTSGQHLLALINDILDLSKIAANQLEVNWEPVAVPNLCRSVLTLVKEKASDQGLKLRLELDPQATTLLADSLRLKQMLFNLLSNALKFTSQGTVGLRVEHRNVFLHFTVWDTGTGISLEEQARLFQPYSQIANVVAGRQEGTGLGLALTQKLAELHGGWVEVQSELNRGSEFTIVLPIAGAAMQVSVAPSSVSGTTSVTGMTGETVPTGERATATLRIMVVEDNLHNAELITTYLGKLGYEVTWVKHAAQMWEALKGRPPALILMDVHLPDVDGLTLLQQLQAHEQYQKIPVIVQTAMAMKGDRETCLAAGAIEYISKPIDLKILATLVSRYSNPPAASS